VTGGGNNPRGRTGGARLLAEGARALVSLGVIAGTALLLVKPAPGTRATRLGAAHETGRRTGRGAFSHHPTQAAVGEGHEVRDLPATGLAMIIGTLGVSAALLVGVVFGMTALFQGWDKSRDAGLTVQQVAAIVPPGPHLQTDPAADLRAQRAREQRALDAYGWLDAKHTLARIPIDRAMQIVNGRPLDDAP
jgi:hypothetical protein